MSWKNRNLLIIFVFVLILFVLSGCSLGHAARLKKDAQSYIYMKSYINQATEEYYAMLERPINTNGIDFEDDSGGSMHQIFFNMLESAEEYTKEIQSEEFEKAIQLNMESIDALKKAYVDYTLFCHAMYLYGKDRSAVYDEGFQLIHTDSYANYEKNDRRFEDYYSMVQDEEDKLDSMGLFEDVQWPDDENEFADED